MTARRCSVGSRGPTVDIRGARVGDALFCRSAIVVTACPALKEPSFACASVVAVAFLVRTHRHHRQRRVCLLQACASTHFTCTASSRGYR